MKSLSSISSKSSTKSGISFGGLLAIVFITLKLTGHITWSWLWVLSPLWIGVAIALVIFALAVIILGLATMFGKQR